MWARNSAWLEWQPFRPLRRESAFSAQAKLGISLCRKIQKDFVGIEDAARRVRKNVKLGNLRFRGSESCKSRVQIPPGPLDIPIRILNMKKDNIKKIVKTHYGEIAAKNSCCCGCGTEASNVQIAKSIGYSNKEIESVPEANLGLGCGNPLGLGEIKEGEIVLDLGSGAGFDCFLASKKVGRFGRVIGIDMTQKMVDRAKENAKKYGYGNVEFKLGDIENLPVSNNSIDVIISNCVVNLVPDKSKVFKEAYRVLKKGGRMYISDIVLLRDLSETQRNNEELIAGCVGGALLKNDYLKIIKNTGFSVTVLSEDKNISKRQYQKLPVESLKIEARK